MLPGSLFDDVSPYARVATAVLPFAVVMLARFCFGKTRTTSWLMTLATVWFAANVLMAPYSDTMRREIVTLSRRLP